jgi:ABC-type multidrug transport system fused ATPase/permease subunit
LNLGITLASNLAAGFIAGLIIAQLLRWEILSIYVLVNGYQRKRCKMTAAIVVENIAKRFEKVEAVSGISLSVQRGELIGFLGPTGADKTTTINMVFAPDFCALGAFCILLFAWSLRSIKRRWIF